MVSAHVNNSGSLESSVAEGEPVAVVDAHCMHAVSQSEVAVSLLTLAVLLGLAFGSRRTCLPAAGRDSALTTSAASPHGAW